MCVCVSDVLDVMLDDIVCGRMGGQAGGRKEEGADTALKNKKHTSMWGNILKSRNLGIIELYLRLPMYAKLLPFQELLLAAFFSASEQILHVSHVAYVCRF